MKKLPFILSLLTVIYSCHNNTPASIGGDAAAISGHEALTAYRQWIATLDTQNIDNARLAIQRFEQTFHRQPQAVCDTAFTIFDQFHERVAAYIPMIRNSDSLATLLSRRTPDMPPISFSPYMIQLQDTLTRNGYGIDVDEGMAIVFSDYYGSFKKIFEPYLSPAMNEYLTRVTKDNREGFQDDAAILIPPDSLAARAVWWEEFTRLHPAFIYADKAADNLLLYRFTLINGMDNTRVDDLDKPGNLSDYYAEAYSFIANHYPNSPINAITSPYYKAWQNKDTATIRQIQEKDPYAK